MNIEAERVIAKAIIANAEIILSRGTITNDSAERCAKEIIERLKYIATDRAFKDVHTYSINYGNDELWKMFLNELLK